MVCQMDRVLFIISKRQVKSRALTPTHAPSSGSCRTFRSQRPRVAPHHVDPFRADCLRYHCGDRSSGGGHHDRDPSGRKARTRLSHIDPTAPSTTRSVRAGKSHQSSPPSQIQVMAWTVNLLLKRLNSCEVIRTIYRIDFVMQNFG